MVFTYMDNYSLIIYFGFFFETDDNICYSTNDAIIIRDWYITQPSFAQKITVLFDRFSLFEISYSFITLTLLSLYDGLIHFINLRRINEMQIEHVFANVNKGIIKNGSCVWSRFWRIQHFIAWIIKFRFISNDSTSNRNCMRLFL